MSELVAVAVVNRQTQVDFTVWLHELHIAGQVFELEVDELQSLYHAWRAALPAEKRIEW
jgi:hypothetical protein